MQPVFQNSRVKVHFPADRRADAWWGGVFSQKRDKVDSDQDNMSDAMKVRFAADMERWAASRANDPGFAPWCFAAVNMAQRVRREMRPRVVTED